MVEDIRKVWGIQLDRLAKCMILRYGLDGVTHLFLCNSDTRLVLGAISKNALQFELVTRCIFIVTEIKDVSLLT